jgi:DNA polymerase
MVIVKTDYDEKMSEATGGVVTKATQVKRLTEFVQNIDPNIATFDKEMLARIRKAPDADDKIVEVAAIREEAGKTSTAKLNAMVEVANADHRARGLFLFNGASTGRWSSLKIQMQNLKRADPHVFEPAIPFFLKGDLRGIDLLFAPVPETVSALIRGCFIAAPGHRLIDADFSNIEGRLTAWYGEEDAALQAFRNFDAGTGPDTYRTTYADTFGTAIKDVGDGERQVGKVISLSCGFGGSVGAMVKMAGNDMKKLSRIASLVQAKVSDDEWQWAGRMYTEDSGLPYEVWTGIKAAVIKWREANPSIVAFWYELINAAVQAVKDEGTVVSVAGGRVKLRVKNKCLWVQLPSGRLLCYYQPHIKQTMMPWHTEEKPALRDTVFFWGMKQSASGGKPIWCEQPLTVPIIVENVVQATARDLMVGAMFNVEDAGYPIIMTVHDELVAEVPHGFGSVEDFVKHMTILPPWAKGLPLAAKGWEGPRYRKD